MTSEYVLMIQALCNYGKIGANKGDIPRLAGSILSLFERPESFQQSQIINDFSDSLRILKSENLNKNW